MLRCTSSVLELFIDGTLVQTGANTSTKSSVVPLSLGCRPEGYYAIDGSLDDVAFFGYPLSNQAIVSLWNGGAGRTVDSFFGLELDVQP